MMNFMQAEHLKKPMEEVSSDKDVTGPQDSFPTNPNHKEQLHKHATFPYATQFLETIFMIMLILHNS